MRYTYSHVYVQAGRAGLVEVLTSLCHKYLYSGYRWFGDGDCDGDREGDRDGERESLCRRRCGEGDADLLLELRRLLSGEGDLDGERE